MKIGISTRGLNQGSHAISTIVLQLTRTMLAMAGPDHEFSLYLNDPSYETYFDRAVKKRSVELKTRFVWDHFWLPRALKEDQVEFALFMKGTLPLSLPCKGGVIYHDFGYFDRALRPYKFFDTIYMKFMMARASRQASAIFADSEFTKSEAVELFNLDPDKIRVCYQNCSPIYQNITDEAILDYVRRRYNLPEKFIFVPSSLSPRKNFDRILDAFGGLRDQIPHHLIITGGQSWRSRELVKRIHNEFKERVRISGYIEHEDMPAIYSLADYTIYPSLLEGFGMPILEAFHCGCPVLTSNIASMPEVAGEAAYLVDPFDTDQIAKGMRRLSDDELLRRSLIKRGFERTKVFSWERTAGIILNEIERH
jgi:glycosyltransferase involved in cell wall biosynthesis